MKKVAFFSYSAAMGGAEHSLLGFLKNFKSNNLQPIFIHTENGPFVYRVKTLGIQTLYLPLGFNVKMFRRKRLLKVLLFSPVAIFKLLAWTRMFRKILKRESICCVHANQPKSHILTMIAVNNIPYIIHLRDIFGKYSFSWFLYGMFFSEKNGRAIAISHAVAKSFPGNVKKKTKVIYNGTELPDLPFNLKKTELISPANESTANICAIGRLVPWKGFELLIDSFAQISENYPKAVLQILGDVMYWDYSYKDKLVNRVKSYGLSDRIIFRGYTDNISEYLFKSRFLVLASKDEPFGRVLIEAMAHAKPVVAFRTGGIPEIIIHQKTGLLVDKRNSTSLAKAMTWMLEHPQEAEQMGREGLLRVKNNFSIHKHVKEMELLLDKTC